MQSIFGAVGADASIIGSNNVDAVGTDCSINVTCCRFALYSNNTTTTIHVRCDLVLAFDLVVVVL